MNRRWVAVGAGVIVTFLWATSYILNQFAFAEGIGPFWLAGLRYLVAAVVLGLVVSWKVRRNSPVVPGKGLGWQRVIILGVTGFVMAQGLQYAGQFFITPTQTSMLLSVGNSALVVLVDWIWLRETGRRGALLGFGVVAAGILLYYYPWELGLEDGWGIGLVLLSSVGYAVHLTLVRHWMRDGATRPETLVFLPMLAGAIGMMGIGVVVEGVPVITLFLWGVVGWLGVVNGAAAYFLWTWSQRWLRAYESSVLNHLVLVQVACLEVWWLAFRPTGWQVLGLVLVLVSILYIQFRPLQAPSVGAQTKDQENAAR